MYTHVYGSGWRLPISTEKWPVLLRFSEIEINLKKVKLVGIDSKIKILPNYPDSKITILVFKSIVDDRATNKETS